MRFQRYLLVNNVNNIDRINTWRGIVFPVFYAAQIIRIMQRYP